MANGYIKCKWAKFTNLNSGPKKKNDLIVCITYFREDNIVRLKIGQEFDHWDKNSNHCHSLSRKHIIPLITEEIKILKFVCKKPLGLVDFIEEFYSIHEEKYINGIFLQKTEQFLVHFMHLRLSC